MKKNKTLILITAIALYVSILSISYYDFYILLRWFVCGVSIYLSFCSYNELKKVPFIEIAIAILFNPLYPIYMEKSMWIIFDLASGSYYLYLYNNLKK